MDAPPPLYEATWSLPTYRGPCFLPMSQIWSRARITWWQHRQSEGLAPAEFLRAQLRDIF
jgi:hypothetical protein